MIKSLDKWLMDGMFYTPSTCRKSIEQMHQTGSESSRDAYVWFSGSQLQYEAACCTGISLGKSGDAVCVGAMLYSFVGRDAIVR